MNKLHFDRVEVINKSDWPLFRCFEEVNYLLRMNTIPSGKTLAMYATYNGDVVRVLPEISGDKLTVTIDSNLDLASLGVKEDWTAPGNVKA